MNNNQSNVINMTVSNPAEVINMAVGETQGTVNVGVVNTQISNNYNKLLNKPQINGVELVGDKSNEDLGIINDKNYVHKQTSASNIWIVEHNLNKYPAVTILNSAGEEVIGDIIYDNFNQITIKFSGAFKGTATLN